MECSAAKSVTEYAKYGSIVMRFDATRGHVSEVHARHIFTMHVSNLGNVEMPWHVA